MAKPVTVAEAFRTRLRQARDARGWSQAQLAEETTKLGHPSFHQTTVTKIETGDRGVTLDDAVMLMQVQPRRWSRFDAGTRIPAQSCNRTSSSTVTES
jgi:transcriptional regulator with XRE-family HTH domain